MSYADVAVLIPAYKPDERMIGLAKGLIKIGFPHIIIVDDGSGASYAPFFSEAGHLGAHILKHDVNRGKGAALRTGIHHILSNFPMAIITADADGQHTCEDICRIASALEMSPNSLVLGIRTKRDMPLRSLMGNTLTAFIFGVMTGLWIEDTQTGLRGLPLLALDGLSQLEGDRYEYEMNMLLHVRQQKIPVLQVRIDTIYIDNNRGSHFHAVRDGLRIYALLFRQIFAFMGSSIIAGLVDTGVYAALQWFYPHLVFLAIGTARALSSCLNYFLNRRIVFHSERNRKSMIGYFLLVGCVLAANYSLIRLLKFLGIPSVVAKLMADLTLFFINYHIQKSVVFKKRTSS